MDSLPALHPIVLNHISAPPFEYSSKGLTFDAHRREAIADLKQGLYPKRKTAASRNKNKDWWLAQLRLYGANAKALMKKEELMAALKGTLSSGQDGSPQELLQLEQNLAREALLEKQYDRSTSIFFRKPSTRRHTVPITSTLKRTRE